MVLLSVLRGNLLSLQNAVCHKLLVCAGCMLFFLTVTRSLPIKYNVDPNFVSQASFLTRLTYAFFSIQASRPKFYFAWTLGEYLVRLCVLLGQFFVLFFIASGDKCHGRHVMIFLFLCQLMQSTMLQDMVSLGWMNMESHPGTSSATSTSSGLRCRVSDA